MTMQRLRTIFASFFKIGLFTFGGGYAMLPLIEVFVGYKMRGLKGAVAALLGSVLPSFVIILAIALMFADIRHNPVVDAAFKGMRPAVVALIVVPVFSLARGMHWSMFFVIAAAAFAVWYLGWSPIYILIAAAAIGISWTLLITKKAKK